MSNGRGLYHTAAITAPPRGHHPQDAARARLETVARLLDSRWRVPGLGIRFGADPLLSVLPGLGPVVSTVISGWLIWQARQLGASPGTVLRMIGNVGLDALISSVPLLGWVGDVYFRANLRNLDLLRRHLDRPVARPR